MKKNRLVILAEGAFGVLGSKTATCVIRHRQEEVVAVIDSTQTGRTVEEILGFGGPIPIVADLAEAMKYSPDSLLIGIAPKGGVLPGEWRVVLKEAISRGLDVYSGMHTFIGSDGEFAQLAGQKGTTLVDLRDVPDDIPVARCLAAGVDAFVVLTVGTDCATGKMTVALEMTNEAARRGLKAHFAPTGQTGIYIAREGIAVDRVIGDFVAGAAERLVLEGAKGNDLVFVEGQGSIFHPGYSGVALAMLHGALPDALILCHQPTRKFVSDYEVPIVPLGEAIRIHDAISAVVKHAPVVGIALNCYDLTEEQTLSEIEKVEKETGVPTTDCVKFGAGKLVDAVIERINSGGKGRCTSHLNP
ncbi:MAG: DUF1611 domain-containing protein [Candidatus Eiseniibacteriota bacterium]|nr:MAG: DUF1611 domain-containing protein [Candidatus Eisenbacteria bacterium]